MANTDESYTYRPAYICCKVLKKFTFTWVY